MASILTIEESKALLALCRTGRLYEIEDWIRAGKSLQIAEGVRGTPFQIAVEKGFRSLIELLVRHESQVRIKNKALAWAVEHRRMDLVELLVKNGAETREFHGIIQNRYHNRCRASRAVHGKLKSATHMRMWRNWQTR